MGGGSRDCYLVFMISRLRFLPLLLVLFPAALAAHPHLWIDGTVALSLDGDGIRAITISWLFDEFNSADMIFSFDENLDGELSQSEVDAIRVNAFEHLVQSDYFTIAFSGAQRLSLPAAENFTARIEDGLLVYEFELPLRVGWNQVDDTVIALFDSSYFIDFVTEPVQSEYSEGRRTLRARQHLLRLQTQGYGTIDVPAVRVLGP
jgi:ABC-type uncharacterized transport system substrate-binding protein